MTDLSPERWRLLAPLLDQLLATDAADSAEQAALLRHLADGDASIQADLEALLGAMDQAPPILEGPFTPLPEEDPMEAFVEAHDPRLGSMIDGYLLVERLGEGGMATVYRGELKDETFEQQVAIKLIRIGMTSAGTLQRFREEQRILASLTHPNIGRLYRGGVAPDGQPYIVMELVEGEPIRTYCDRHQLGLEARLALFQTVCQAIEYAHSSLVIHRDLKPSNILVDEQGNVKVLDFGIAKWVVDEGEEDEAPSDEASSAEPRIAPRTSTTLTSLYGAPLTPEFAAPEQMLGQPITTSTDVYALGVLLYDLLSGHRPHELSGLSVPQQIERVTEQEPQRPSERVHRQTTKPGYRPVSGEEIAKRRGTTLQRLRKRLVGDLDTIVLKALRRDRERRYASVAALREDIERFLEHQPIRARPESLSYVLGRFVRRHRLSVGLGLLVALSLLVGLGAALVGQRAAKREAATSERIANFLVETFRAPDPTFGSNTSVTARELLQRSARRIQTERDLDLELKARLVMVLGESSYGIGDFEQAESLAHEAVELLTNLRGPEATETLGARNFLARVWATLNHVEEAEETFRQVLEITSRKHPRSALHATINNDLASMLSANGNTTEAKRLDEEALQILQDLGEGDGREAMRTLNNLAVCYRIEGDLETAEEMLRQAVVSSRRIFQEPNSDIATVLNNLAAAVRRLGRAEEAEELYREALAQRLAVLGEDHPDVAQSYNNVGSTLYYRGDLDGAAEAFSTALSIWQRAFDGDHPRLADSLSNIGSLRRKQGRLDEARAMLEQSATMRERLNGPDHVLVGQALSRWGSAELEAGHWQKAADLLFRAVEIGEATGSLADERTRSTALELVDAWRNLGRTRETQELLDRLEEAVSDDPEAAQIVAEARVS